MASATGVRPAAGLGDAGFFFPFFLSLLFSFGFVLFFGAGRTGKARRKLLESSRGITIPYPCSPPRTVGAALAFLHPPALLQDLRQQSPNPPWLQALPEPPGECGWRSLSVPLEVPGAVPSRVPLALARAVPRGGRRPGTAPSAPLWPRPRGVLLLLPSFRVPTSLSGSTKVVFPAGPALLEGPRPPMLLKPPVAPPAPSGARRGCPAGRKDPRPSPAESQSSLEMFRGFIFCSYL